MKKNIANRETRDRNLSLGPQDWPKKSHCKEGLVTQNHGPFKCGPSGMIHCSVGLWAGWAKVGMQSLGINNTLILTLDEHAILLRPNQKCFSLIPMAIVLFFSTSACFLFGVVVLFSTSDSSSSVELFENHSSFLCFKVDTYWVSYPNSFWIFVHSFFSLPQIREYFIHG